jgi:hypothetical protein
LQAKDATDGHKELSEGKDGEKQKESEAQKKEEKQQQPPPFKPQPPPPSIALQACRLGKQLLEPHAYSLSSELHGQQLSLSTQRHCVRQLNGCLGGHSFSRCCLKSSR